MKNLNEKRPTSVLTLVTNRTKKSFIFEDISSEFIYNTNTCFWILVGGMLLHRSDRISILNMVGPDMTIIFEGLEI